MGKEEEALSFACEADYVECSRIHRQYGTTYYFASRRLPALTRRRVDGVYGFVRLPDEWVDNPGDLTTEQVRCLLSEYRQEMIAATYGVRPERPVLRAFADVMRETGMSPEEPIVFLDAMEQDLTKTRYATYDELRQYMRGSAMAVGLMLLHVLSGPQDESTRRQAMALGEAMQLTNFLRDVGEDLARDRIYLPQDELAQFGITEEDLREGRLTPEWSAFMDQQIARAKDLFREAEAGIKVLPAEMRFGVSLARELYAKILDKIVQNGYDVFRHRASTSAQEKMLTAWKLWSSIQLHETP